MSMNIIKEKTCAVTGHRALDESLDKDRLKGEFYALIERGIDTFLCGMALGFDTLCFETLQEIRKIKKIKIIACIPCKNQDKKFNFYQKLKYQNLIKSADEQIVLSEEYTPECMMNRNRFMVDNASILVAYLRHNYGGTKNTVNYAKDKQIEIIKV